MKQGMRFFIYGLSVAMLAVPIYARAEADLIGYYGAIYPLPLSKSLSMPDFKNVADMSLLRATMIEVHVFERDKNTCIDWMITRNPTGRILEGRSLTTRGAHGELIFQFQDSWGNKGQGRFFSKNQDYILDMRVVEPSGIAKDTIGMYASYLVDRQSFSPRGQKHLWSLRSDVSCP